MEQNTSELATNIYQTNYLNDTNMNNMTSNGSDLNSTDFTNDTDNYTRLIFDPAIQAPFYVLYGIIFVVGVFGNVLICYVVGRNKAMQTVTNFFIANLALADILLCVLGVPFTPLYSFIGDWVFGRMLCHLVAYAQGVSVYVSALTLTSIAVDRYFVILHPFRPRMKLTTCLLIISCIWMFALCATLPYGIFMELQYVNGHIECSESWVSDIQKVFGAVTTTLQFIVPFLLITYAYAKVCVRLQNRAKTKPGVKSTRGEEIDRERKRRTNRMLIAMVAIFALSWLPLNLLNLMNDMLESEFSYWEYYEVLFFICHCIAMSSTCYNVFLYAWLNDNFKKEFKLVLPCFKVQNPEKNKVRSIKKSPEHTRNENQNNGDAKDGSLRTVHTYVAPEDVEFPDVAEQARSDLIAEFRVDTETIQLKTAGESDECVHEGL